MKSPLKIKSRHTTLLEAVRAAGIDLSYNEPLALRDIAGIDSGHRQTANRAKAGLATKAYVTEDNEVYWVYEADIALLHKFSPFCHCISDSPFTLVHDCGDTLERYTGPGSIPEGKALPKVPANRKWISCLQALNRNVFAYSH